MYKPRCARYMRNSKAFRHDFCLRKVIQLDGFPEIENYMIHRRVRVKNEMLILQFAEYR